jgi:hypothetical protein
LEEVVEAPALLHDVDDVLDLAAGGGSSARQSGATQTTRLRAYLPRLKLFMLRAPPTPRDGSTTKGVRRLDVGSGFDQREQRRRRVEIRLLSWVPDYASKS